MLQCNEVFILIFYFFIFRCELCQEINREQCYPIGDERSIAVFQDNLRRVLDAYIRACSKSYEDIKHSSTIIYDPTDLNAVSNPLNIDYVPTGNSPQETRLLQQNFSNLLSKELALRGVSRQGSLEDRRQRLQEYLIVEMDMDCVMQSISRGEEGKAAALILITQVIPCCMHLENRVGEKLITVLLSLGAQLYQKRNTRGLHLWAKSVQDFTNTRILGTLFRQSSGGCL